jgi:hypothetical protein
MKADLSQSTLDLVRQTLEERSETLFGRMDLPKFWKDANPDFPILIDAKAEYAKLQ